MKKSILYLAFILLNYYHCYSQEIINNFPPVTDEGIQQIHLPGINDILVFQNMNRGISNYVMSQQTGIQNQVNISQNNSAGFELSNQSYTFQSGNSNELTIDQIGKRNLMLGFQMGYQATFNLNQIVNQPGFLTINDNATGSMNIANGYTNDGERNKMYISQQGNSNGVMAVQQGSDNMITANQNGSNNYLFVYQKGSNNSLTDYNQENVSEQILLDKVTQIGENLSLQSDIVSKTSIKGNTFLQTGTNLSLKINSDLINSAGGIDIKQTGKDMKVVIDQSYFSFPLK